MKLKFFIPILIIVLAFFLYSSRQKEVQHYGAILDYENCQSSHQLPFPYQYSHQFSHVSGKTKGSWDNLKYGRNLNWNQKTLFDIPMGYFDKYPCLTHAYLLNNHFKAFPNALGQLPEIEHIDLKNNQIEKLSIPAFESPILIIDLQTNNIQRLGKIEQSPTNFKFLLDENQMTAFPFTLFKNKINELSISKNQIARFDPISNYQYNFKSLEVLDLSENQISTYPSFLKLCTNLSTLNLSGNDLDGTIQTNYITSLRNLNLAYQSIDTFKLVSDNMQTLQVLNLSYNNIKTFEVTALQRSLKELNLSFNQLRAIPLDIKYFNQLKHIDLSGNQLKSVNFHQYFRSPKAINLSHNEIETVKGLGKIEAGYEVNLSHNNIQKMPYILWSSSILRHLDLSHNKIKQLTFYDQANSVFGVQYLNLSHNQITTIPTSLHTKADNFQFLNQLDLSYNPITTIDVNMLKKLPVLQELNLKGTNISPDEILKIKSQLSDTEIRVIY